jgi:hypothetical protein
MISTTVFQGVGLGHLMSRSLGAAMSVSLIVSDRGMSDCRISINIVGMTAFVRGINNYNNGNIGRYFLSAS